MSLNGPMGSNYVYSCCDKEVNVTQILNQQSETSSGCDVQVHEVSQTYMMEQAKEKKITDRIIAHQLIILENTVNDHYIEKISIREFNKMDEKDPTIKLTKGNGKQPPSLVRPSSLNYKISLREAVTEFIKKDMPLADDQYIYVETEENKVSSSSKNANNNDPYEDYIDLMWDMTIPNPKQSSKKGIPQTPY